MASNVVKVEYIGSDKSLGRSMKNAAKDATTFRGKLHYAGLALRKLIHGDFKGAGAALKTLGGGFSRMGMLAGAAAAAVGVAMALVVRWVVGAMRRYEEYMTGLVKIQRLTGMTAAQTSILANQLRLSGVDGGKAATGLRFFAKNLDMTREAILKARRGLAGLDETSEGYAEKLAAVNLRIKDAGGAFERLGVNLVDAGGEYRDTSDVLADVRDRISEIEDPAKRAGIAIKIFGRGGADMLPWLMRSAREMRAYTELTKKLGLVMSGKAVDAFKEYRQNQRELSLGWDAIKINAAAALVPLINKLMPSIITLIHKAAGWIGRFRDLVEKRGWGDAIKKMLPWLGGIIENLKTAKKWWDRNKESIGKAAEKIWDATQALGDFIGWVLNNKEAVRSAFLTMFGPIGTAVNMLFAAYGLIQKIGDKLGISGGNKPAGSMGGKSASTVHPHGHRALGGPVFASSSGDPYMLHDRETVVAHKDPRRGLEDLAESGIIARRRSGTGDIVFENCTFSAHTPREIAEQVRNVLRADARIALRTAGSFA